MVYTGRPSAGCESCRKSKKRCDQALPACGRCVRLGKTCGGYRDVAELMFKDESHSVSKRLGNEPSSSGTRPSPPKQSRSPDSEARARSLFFDQFITPSHLSCLEGTTIDDFLSQPVLACAMDVLGTRQTNDPHGPELARKHYVEAMHSINQALLDPQRAKNDNTIFAILLLSTFERLNWDSRTTKQDWSQHVQGMALVLQLRGREQLKSKRGLALFRDTRTDIITNSLYCEIAAPQYLLEWSQQIANEQDRDNYPLDHLCILALRIASLRQSFRLSENTDESLLRTANDLDHDLQTWAEVTAPSNTPFSFRRVHDTASHYGYNGTRHEYGSARAYRYWNTQRTLRILVSRIQEALWRRSWPALAQPQQPIPQSEYFRSIRNHMSDEICAGAAHVLGDITSKEVPKGSVAHGGVLLSPLTVAGLCLLESLAETTTSPGGSRLILLDQAYHLDPYNQASTQLKWIIDRVEHIGARVGIRAAIVWADFLKGEDCSYYDLGRSTMVRGSELMAAYEASAVLDLDLSNIVLDPATDLS